MNQDVKKGEQVKKSTSTNTVTEKSVVTVRASRKKKSAIPVGVDGTNSNTIQVRTYRKKINFRTNFFYYIFF